MTTLVVNVPDEQAEKLRAELNQLPGVQTIVCTHDANLKKMWPDWAFTYDSLLIRAEDPGSVTVSKINSIDEITLVSEASLAEAWLSPEDDVWDDIGQL